MKSYTNKTVTLVNLVAEMVKKAADEIAQSTERYTSSTVVPIEDRRVAVIGDILAAVLNWDGEDIIKAAQTAMEDSNFPGEVIYMEDGHIVEWVDG